MCTSYYIRLLGSIGSFKICVPEGKLAKIKEGRNDAVEIMGWSELDNQ